jgi:predicted permease
MLFALRSSIADFWQDVRFATRLLRKSPGFAFAAIATLAIGIGANTTIFSAVDAVLFRPLPYPDPDRLVHAFESLPSGGRNPVSGASFLDWRKHQTKLAALSLYASDQFDLTGLGDPEKINALSVTSEFTRVLGIPPLLGRGFEPADEQVGGQNDVVMLTERFWRSRFNGSPDVLGKKVILDGRPRTIIGVMPDRAWHYANVTIYAPYVLAPNSYLTSHDVHRAHAIGRLAPGATIAAAEAELNAIKHNLQATYPTYKHTWGVALQPTQTFLGQASRSVLLLLLGAVVLVLLIACANVANLLLARASTRRREIGVRIALGASSRRIVRQVITESLLLALLGGLAGTLLAAWSIDLLGSLSARLLPSTMTPQLDLRVLSFSLLASCGTGLLFGILPAWRSRRPDLTPALKSGSGATDGTRTRSQSALVVAEVTLTAVLLVGTGMLLRGLAQSVTADPGINPKNVLTFGLTMPFGGTYGSAEQRLSFLERATAEIRSVPGVLNVATTDHLPFTDGGQGYFFSLEERPETRQDRSGAIKYVSPEYFATLGATLIRGRAISAPDNLPNAPRVLVVNQELVRVLFANEDPIGRHLNVGNQPWEIIGVVADLRLDSLHTAPRPMFFASQAHFPWGSAFLVRTQGDPLAVTRDVAAAIHRLDPNLPLANLDVLERAMKASLGPQKLILNLIGIFAATALLLACIGLYGVMSYSVSNRARELSIRTALGAARRDIFRLIVGHGARLIVLGLVLGLAASIALGRVLVSRLHGLTAGDPLVLGCAASLLVAVALVACWLPARRAAKADPVAALRAE